jgi:hypothetical protein
MSSDNKYFSNICAAFMLVLLLSCFMKGMAQTIIEPGSFKFKKTLKEANDFFAMEDFKSAEELYLNIWPGDSLNEKINLNIGICKFQRKRAPREILPYLLKADKDAYPASQFYLGKVYHLTGNFDEAIIRYNKYKTFSEELREFKNEEVERCIEMSDYAKKQMQQPHKAFIKNAGRNINTKYPEYVPLISPDGNDLYFTSRRPGSTGSQTDVFGNFYEDIYVSHKVNGSWGKPENLGAPINTENHDACVSLSPDGKTMLIFRTSYDLSSGDLYSTNWNGKAWSAPVMMGPEINSDAKELSACTNNENTMIIFSSDRAGGVGGKDLYRVLLLPNGKWSMAQNLGADINTKYDEDAPFISSDEKYLYFSSNGKNTMGGYDIFRSDALPERAFGKPQNLGYPINSVGDDIFFVTGADAKYGYFSSLNEDAKDPNYLSEDIFLTDMRYDENETCVKKGVCVFEGDGNFSQVQISVYDEATQKITGIYKPNGKNGTFIFTVNPYERYKIIAETKGYKPVSIQFEPLVEQKDYEIEIDLLTIEFKKL